jgi:phosphopantothenoylcysteine decarboxylase/phosphopantothenate--cysteine ligase
MNTLTDKHILLGITGSIAAYKSADLVRRLREQGAQVQVIMTTAATAFITPLTLQVVSGQPVYTQLFNAITTAAMEHIELARWADVVLIAPTSADFLAKLAGGHADDLLSTVCLATSAPIVVTPAMNSLMWQAPATQENCRCLQSYGVKFFGPATGSQACGETGSGRMLEPLEIVQQLQDLFQAKFLSGYQVLVTAGPTREDIDPVRFISNRSSGRMGYALAQAAQRAGAQVTLISGPVALSPLPGVQLLSVYSAQEMLATVMTQVVTADIFIATAAVADYCPSQPLEHKFKKHETYWQITLTRTPDILATVTSLPNPPFTVGFAAETDNLLEYAQKKLQQKKLDMIIANLVGIPGIGFDSEENQLSVLWAEGCIELPRAAKTELAKHLLEIIVQQYQKSGRLTPVNKQN